MREELEQQLFNKYEYMFEEMRIGRENHRVYQEHIEKLYKAKEAKDKELIKKLEAEREELKPFYPIVFGFEHDSGWYNLVDELMANIAKLDTNKEVRVHQIKEKFAGLRFYISGAPIRMDVIGEGSFTMSDNEASTIDKLISDAEDKSFEICETCGQPGKVCSSGYWLKTLCKDHRATKDPEYIYKPVTSFRDKETVIIIETNTLETIVKHEFNEEKDEWLFTLANNDIKNDSELKHIPFGKFNKNWCVTNKNINDTEFVIISKDFNPDFGWTYVIKSDSIIITAKEDELETVTVTSDTGYKQIKLFQEEADISEDVDLDLYIDADGAVSI